MEISERATRTGLTLLTAITIFLAARADAQVPSWTVVQGTPLPGPAPSAVVAQPPPALPPQAWTPAPPPWPAGPAAAVVSPSPWDALREAEDELRRREEDLSRCRARLGAVTEDLGRTQERLLQLEGGMQALRAEVLRRMVLLDRIGRGGAARLVLTSRDPAEARFRSSLVRRLVRADADMAIRYFAMRDEAESIRAELARKLSGQQTLERQLEERRRRLADEVDRHRRLLSTLSTPSALTAMAEDARAELQGVAADLDLLPPAAAADRLAALAEAAVAVPASFPIHADDVHGGLAVDVPAGAPVAAPAGGTVAFAGVLAGYGPTVLLRTSSGVGVLLGHLDELFVAPGEAVAAGAILGSTAPSYSPLLPPLLVDFVVSPIHES
jgi:septal ring factor EnvC (AmiA/AmiB activator)